jgi:hypothetical protein
MIPAFSRRPDRGNKGSAAETIWMNENTFSQRIPLFDRFNVKYGANLWVTGNDFHPLRSRASAFKERRDRMAAASLSIRDLGLP